MLHMAGDIDMLTLPLVRAALITALDTRPADLVVDLSEVRFCGVRGSVVRAAMARTTARCGIGYAVAGVGPTSTGRHAGLVRSAPSPPPQLRRGGHRHPLHAGPPHADQP